MVRCKEISDFCSIIFFVLLLEKLNPSAFSEIHRANWFWEWCSMLCSIFCFHFHIFRYEKTGPDGHRRCPDKSKFGKTRVECELYCSLLKTCLVNYYSFAHVLIHARPFRQFQSLLSCSCKTIRAKLPT